MTNAVTQIKAPYTVDTFNGGAVQILWKTDEGDFLITSSVFNKWAAETLVFRSDEDGRIRHFIALGAANYNDHEGALEDAGFVISEEVK